jgi:peptidylprolyl isomerase
MLRHTLSTTVAIIALTACAATQTIAQTTTPAKSAATTTKSSTAARSTTSVGSTALPKGIPPVKGLPRTAYSLKYIDVVLGKGELAQPMKLYTVNYRGWLRSNGTEFDSSYPDKDHLQRKPVTFPVGLRQVIPGFDTAFEGMRVGGKRRVFIPYQLAYGAAGSRLIPGKPQAIPPNSDLVFDIELLSIAELPKQQPPPMQRPMPMPVKPGTPAPGMPGGPTAPSTPANPSAPPAAPTPSAAPAPTAPPTAPPPAHTQQ